MELWYVKFDSGSFSAASGAASSTLLSMAFSASSTIPPLPTNELLAMPSHVLSIVLKPVGIKNIGHTCHLITLTQIILWVVPLRKRLIEKKLSTNDPKNYNQYFRFILRLTVIFYLKALGF
jgi:ubiquitin C-terminal hydrolase